MGLLELGMLSLMGIMFRFVWIRAYCNAPTSVAPTLWILKLDCTTPHCTNLMLIQTIGGRYQIISRLGGGVLPSLLKILTYPQPQCVVKQLKPQAKSTLQAARRLFDTRAEVSVRESRSDSTTFSLLRGKSRILWCRNLLKVVIWARN